jgi:hypothetical protein
MSDILQLEDYLFKGLLSCHLFNNYNVVLERQFLAQAELDVSTLWLTPRTDFGPVGAALYVEMPKLQVPKPNSLQRNLVASICAIENRNINLLDTGTGTSCEDLAELALDFMFGWVLGFTSGLTPDSAAITPASDLLQGDGLVVLRASISLRREHQSVARCAMPSIDEPTVGYYGLYCATSGAAIYYTLDRSFPGPANSAAVVYTAPMVLTDGQVITFAAWKDALLPSHVAVKIVSTNGDLVIPPPTPPPDPVVPPVSKWRQTLDGDLQCYNADTGRWHTVRIVGNPAQLQWDNEGDIWV